MMSIIYQMISRTNMIMEVISIVIVTPMSTVRLQMAMKISSLETVTIDLIALGAVKIMVAVQSISLMIIKNLVAKMFSIAFQMLNIWSF
jgi:hypothetical protein